MAAPLGVDEVEQFRLTVADRLGLAFDDSKIGYLGEVLRRRLDASGRSCDRYLQELEGRCAAEELGALASELTVPETYFFRNRAQLDAFREHVVPERLRRAEPEPRLRVLSAGCASGEEPYSLAIVLRECAGDRTDTSVVAVDVNPVVLAKARRGRYSPWSMRETPPDVQHLWFRHDSRQVTLDDRIRESVVFVQLNLADDAGFWEPQTFDVIFCRNVLMYWTPERARVLVDRLAQALAPGGYLFLGHAETLRGLSRDFHLCHTHGTFYYQRGEQLVPREVTTRTAGAPGFEPDEPPLATLVDETDNWVDAIRAASERVRRLVDDRPGADRQSAASGPTVSGPTVSGPTVSRLPGEEPSWDLDHSHELLREERFAEALEAMATLPAEATSAPDVLLLRAVLLAHAGELGRAEETCRDLLRIDELDAGAHYVLALCREGFGDNAAAVDLDRTAAYLDPGFAMPRLHLGLLARRAGDLTESRRELRQAVTLLEREDPARLLLFGGGFGRDALLELCRAELVVGADIT